MFLFFSFYSLFKFFTSKILVLLCLEGSFLALICLGVTGSFSGKCTSSFFSSMIFITFMVIDSVFGLSLLIMSSRNSTFFNNFFFTL